MASGVYEILPWVRKHIWRKDVLRITVSLIFLLAPALYGYRNDWNIENYYKIYSIWGVIWAVINYIIVYHQKINMNKYSNVYKLIEKYDSEYLRSARDYSRKHSSQADQISPKELLEKISKDDDFHRSVIYLFNFWEVVYRMLEHDTVDKEWTKSYFYTPFMSNYKIYTPWLEETSSDKYKDRDKYGKEAIENLYKLWKE